MWQMEEAIEDAEGAADGDGLSAPTPPPDSCGGTGSSAARPGGRSVEAPLSLPAFTSALASAVQEVKSSHEASEKHVLKQIEASFQAKCDQIVFGILKVPSGDRLESLEGTSSAALPGRSSLPIPTASSSSSGRPLFPRTSTEDSSHFLPHRESSGGTAQRRTKQLQPPPLATAKPKQVTPAFMWNTLETPDDVRAQRHRSTSSSPRTTVQGNFLAQGAGASAGGASFRSGGGCGGGRSSAGVSSARASSITNGSSPRDSSFAVVPTSQQPMGSPVRPMSLSSAAASSSEAVGKNLRLSVVMPMPGAVAQAPGPSRSSVPEELRSDVRRPTLESFTSDSDIGSSPPPLGAVGGAAKGGKAKLLAHGSSGGVACKEADASSKHDDSDKIDDSSDDDVAQPRRFSEIEARYRAKSMALDNFTFDSEEEAKKASCVERMVKSRRFEALSASILFINAASIGWQVEAFASGVSEFQETLFIVINNSFCAYFLMELILRIIGFTPFVFFFGHDKLWNIFDLFVVSLQLVESGIMILTLTVIDRADLPRLSLFIGVVRMSRVARVIRVVSVLRWVRPFRVLVTAIFGTLRSCIWAALLLMLIMYVFAIIFTQSVAEYMEETYPAGEWRPSMHGPNADLLLVYYGTLPRAFYTLYKAIIGGVDWEVVAMPLSALGAPFVGLFLLYISFVLIAVMNVVQGLFLQSAIEQAQTDQEHVIQLRLKEKASFVDRLKQLFLELDSSQDGLISLIEFEAHLKDERMQAFLQTFEIESSDAWTLFRLLDTDGGGTVDVTEFVDGCIRLKGGAKSIQVAQLAYHHKWIMEKLADVAEAVCFTAERVSRGGPSSPKGSPSPMDPGCAPPLASHHSSCQSSDIGIAAGSFQSGCVARNKMTPSSPLKIAGSLASMSSEVIG